MSRCASSLHSLGASLGYLGCPRHHQIRSFSIGLSASADRPSPPPSSTPQGPVYQSPAAVARLRERIAQRKASGQLHRPPQGDHRPSQSRSAIPFARRKRDASRTAPSDRSRILRERPSRSRRQQRVSGYGGDEGENLDLESEDGDDYLDEKRWQELQRQLPEAEKVIDDMLGKEPEQPVVPFDPSFAAEPEYYDHPGPPMLNTGDSQGLRKARERLLGDGVQLPRHSHFDLHDVAMHASEQGRGSFVRLPADRTERNRLLDSTWTWAKTDKYQQRWRLTPVDEGELEHLQDIVIDGKYEHAEEPSHDPAVEIPRRAKNVIGMNGSYGIAENEQFMAKIRELASQR